MSLQVSPGLTWLGPQPPHKTVIGCRFRSSERFDHIFRNEGGAGSILVSSTICPGQSGSRTRPTHRFRLCPESRAPQTPHKIHAVTPSQDARCFLTPSYTNLRGCVVAPLAVVRPRYEGLEPHRSFRQRTTHQGSGHTDLKGRRIAAHSRFVAADLDGS